MQANSQRDCTATFRPHHLNRQPVVVRGLTADEVWVYAGLSATVGLALGIPLAWLRSTHAMVPTLTCGRHRHGRVRRRWRVATPQAGAARNLAVPAPSVVDRAAPSRLRALHGRQAIGHAVGLLNDAQGCAMSRFKNQLTHLQAHIKTLRMGAGALFAIALVLGFGWCSAPRDLTISVPPDLCSGSVGSGTHQLSGQC